MFFSHCLFYCCNISSFQRGRVKERLRERQESVRRGKNGKAGKVRARERDNNPLMS